MCPANLQSRCKGKEPRNVSSLVFELVSSHTKRILSVSGVQYGTDSDKTISRSDSAVLRIRKEGDILKESTFGYYTEDGSVAEERGYYYIVDGGYNNWIELIAPFKQEPESSIAHIWSKQIEPVQKDVDCVFGILKNRFMILKHPMRLRKMESIEHVFLACAVLHNMLINYDGRDDQEEREELKDLEDVESDVEGDGEERRDECLQKKRAKNPLSRIGASRHELRQRAVSRATTDDTVLVDIKEDEDDRIPATVKEAYLNRQKMRMTHFKVASDKNEVR